MNFDLNRFRSVIRGEVNGSIGFLISAFCAAAVWIAISWVSGMDGSAMASLKLQQGRYTTLSQLAAEYKALGPGSANADVRDADALAAFSRVSSQLVLGERVNKIAPSPDGKSLSIEVNRLYAEELADMIRELDTRGFRLRSAVLRAVPVAKERLFSLTAVVDSKD